MKKQTKKKEQKFVTDSIDVLMFGESGLRGSFYQSNHYSNVKTRRTGSTHNGIAIARWQQ